MSSHPGPVVSLDQQALATLASVGSLDQFLRQSLLVEAIAQDILSDEERQQALIHFAEERRLSSQEDLERFRIANLLSPQALALQVELPLRLRKHCERVYLAKAEARFLERKQHLDQVVYSLLRLQDEGLAQELYLQLQDDEASFAELAARYTEGPERATRGIVGPVPLTQSHPLLVERLRAAPAGFVQEPFAVDRWWLLLRLESFTPAVFDDAMAQQMSRELFDQWLERAIETLRAQLRPLLLASETNSSLPEN